MLRSNRKNSPDMTSSNGGPSSTVLPSYYSNGSNNSSQNDLLQNSNIANAITLPSTTPSIPFPTPKRRRRKYNTSSGGRNGRKSGFCSTMALVTGVVLCTFLGTYFVFHHRKPTSSSSSMTPNKSRTLADPPSSLTTRTDPYDYNTNRDEKKNPSSRRATALEQANAAAIQPSMIIPPKPPRAPDNLYDVVILGTGPAGLTAALFAARAGLSTLCLGSDGGSLLSETHLLQNFPSFVGKNGGSSNIEDDQQRGPTWLETTKQQAAQWGASFVQAGVLVDRMQVQQIPSSNNDNNEEHHNTPTTKFVFTSKVGRTHLQIRARSVIVATGATGRRLNLPLEDDLWGKSVHSCAVCDGSSYIDKTVVVVGGGDAAMDGALLLARYAKEVIVVHRRAELRASNQRNIDLVRSTSNIRVMTPYAIQEFQTEEKVTSKNKQRVLTGVQLEHLETNAVEHVSCDGVFELIGSTPNTNWLRHHQEEGGENENNNNNNSNNMPQLDQAGFLLLSNKGLETRTATTLEGVFAAGEVTDQIYRQAITAAAEGAQAAMDAERWLRMHPPPPLPSEAVVGPTIPLQAVLVVPDDVLSKHQLPNDETERKDDNNNNHESDSADSIDCDLTQEDCITKLVHRYPVVVFSKPWCGFCRKALEALAAEGLAEGHKELYVVDLSLLGDKTRQVQGMLKEMTGRRTVPNVFVGGISIGGGDETVSLHRDGSLRTKLIDAKAITPDDVTGGDGDGTQGQAGDGNDIGSGGGGGCEDLTQETCITQLVNQYAVVVFSKNGCPHCRRALEALALDGLPLGSRDLHVVNLSTMPDMKLIQDQLENMTGRRTVPNVFLGGSSIGGGSETVQLQRSGDLRTMLDKVHSIAAGAA